jgi:hypothetical protein
MGDIETISNDNFFTVVVDPNGLNKENVRNEDLFIYVDFRSLPKTRSVVHTDGSVVNEIFETKGISFIASKKQNGSNYLTTDYTNIGGSNPKEEEGFGIEKINIEYGKEFNPLIKIEFVDVRGAGLLNGYESVDDNGILSNNSTFSSFFSLPYPIFKLTVKGFYGKAVSYCLHLMKWTLELDGQTGNFKIVAEFQGYTFAFFNDILLKHVVTIINTSVGQEALKKHNVISMSELVTRLGKLTSISEEYKKNSKTFEELKFINSLLLDRIEFLSNSIGEVMTLATISSFGSPLPIPQLSNGTDQLFIRDVGLISEEKIETLKIIVEDLGKYINEYNDFIKTNSSKYPYGNEYKIDDFDISVPTIAYLIDDSTTNIIIDKVKKDGLSDNNALTTTSAIRSRLNMPNNSAKKYYIVDFHKFRKEVSQIKSDLSKKKSEIEKKVNDELNKDIETQLNLKLNISNVMEIILGNVEAYLKVVYDYAVAADDPYIQSQRLSSIRGAVTDIPITYENRVFPFPSTFDRNTGEELWIGDIVGDDNPYFPEIELVRLSLNSVVTSEGKNVKDKVNNDSGTSVTPIEDSWIPLYLDDISKPYSNINNITYSGNDIPLEVIFEIKSRLFKAYLNTAFSSDTLQNLAKTDASFTYYQIKEQVLKNLFNNTSNENFINTFATEQLDVFNITSILDNNTIYIGSTTDTKGTVLETLSKDIDFKTDSTIISSIQNQEKRKIIKEINDEIEALKKPLEDILIPNKYKKLHRQVDRNTYLIKGDITDLIWTEEVKSNIRKFYKSETSNDLLQEVPVNFTISSKINDFSIFDGQINPAVDFSKPIDPNSKFINIKRNKIGLDLLPPIVGATTVNTNSKSLLNTYYYKFSSPLNKAYLFLLTTPIDNISDFYKVLEFGGMYKITKIQLAWVAGQFWRAKFKKTYNKDIFDVIIDNIIDAVIKNLINLSAEQIVQAKILLSDLGKQTEKYLPNLSDFSQEFIDKLAKFYESWAIRSYNIDPNLLISDYTNQDKSIETTLLNFLDFYSSGANFSNSVNFEGFKYYYDLLLKEFTEPIDLHVLSVNSILSGGKKIFDVPEEFQRSYATQWISTFKKLASQNNRNEIKTNNDSNTGTNGFYIADKDTKLAAYKYFKNLYDKWLGGTKDGKVFNSCSGGLSNVPGSKLIDRFHFVDSAFNPIGHIAVANPEVLRTLTNSYDLSLFIVLKTIGDESGFLNLILPSFVNYKSPKEGLEMWKPQTTIENVNSGAAYFFVYTQHQDSKVLDIGKKSFYANDGFDLRGSDIGNIPQPFKKRVPLNIDQIPKDKDKYNLVVFRVGYADQNQNIFKSIKMNQTEHKASMEYVQAFIEMYDPKGGTKPMYKKANLYNIFSLRQYQVDVTCLGNLNLHPLNYFQLDNVPFYHGAYQVLKVSHSITPGNAETTFSGWRMPRFVHPVLKTVTAYIQIPLSDSLFNEKERRKPVFRSLAANYSEAEIAPDNSGSSPNVKSYKLGEDIGTATSVTTPEFTGSLINISGFSANEIKPLNLIENVNSLDRSGLWATSTIASKIQISSAEYTSLINKAKQSNSPSAQIMLIKQTVPNDKLGTLDKYLKGLNTKPYIVGKSRVARPLTAKADLDAAYGYIDFNTLPADDDVNTPGRAEFYSKNIRAYTLPFGLRTVSNNGSFSGLITKGYFHKEVGDSFVYAMKEVLDFYGFDNIESLGINLTAGTFNYRRMRGGSLPSLHAYGAAIDLGAGQFLNAAKWSKKDALFGLPVYRPFLDIMEKWGWYNQGRYRNNDYMHFQAAIYGNIQNY